MFSVFKVTHQRISSEKWISKRLVYFYLTVIGARGARKWWALEEKSEMNICFTVSRKKMRKRDQVFMFLIICSISFSWRLSLFGFFRFDLSRNELVSQVWKIFQIWRTDFLNKPRVFWINCLFVCFLVCLFQLSSPFLFLVKG